MRVTIWGAYLWACQRPNIGCLYYLPENSEKNLKDIPSLKEPLNEKEYIVENDNFNLFLANNCMFISESMRTSPKANICDGYNDIVCLKSSNSGKIELFNELVFYSGNGDIYKDKEMTQLKAGINYYKTKFWRFIPKKSLNEKNDINIRHTFRGYYSIDGERYPICPMQVKCMKEALRVYSGKE